jgi:syntaxin 1B/2/3
MEKTALIDNDEFIQDRYEGMIKLEQTMQDVNDIYRDLSVIIHQQGDMLDNIEMNVTAGADSVASGTRELGRAEKHQRRARNSKCWLLAVLLVILAIMALILGSTLAKHK